MARIAGINIPPHKHTEIGLTHIYGIGRTTAQKICNTVNVAYSKKIKDLTGGRGADIVVEHVGQATWDRSVRSLARGGRLVTCGATTGPRAQLDLRHLFARQLQLIGSYMGEKRELLAAAPLLFDGRLKPVIDEVVPLAEAAAAQVRLEAGKQFGKIVLSVGGTVGSSPTSN